MTRLTFGFRLLAVLALVVSTQSALVVRVMFEARQEWIAEHLCENRNHPERKCNGMCFLRRQMQAHDHHGEDSGPTAVMPAPVFVALVLPAATVPPDHWRDSSAPTPAPLLAAACGAPEGVFHPPRLG